MRAEKTAIGVATLPNWRRVKKYTSFISSPRGLSTGGRYVAIAEILSWPELLVFWVNWYDPGRSEDVTGGREGRRNRARCSLPRPALIGSRTCGATRFRSGSR